MGGPGWARYGVARQGVAWSGEVRQGIGWTVFGGVRLSTTHATRLGLEWPGAARRGAVWLGGVVRGKEIEMGDWQASGFKPSTPTQLGTAGRGWVRQGDARRGSAWLDMAGSGAARPGVDSGVTVLAEVRLLRSHAAHGVAGTGCVGPGEARLGDARRGKGMAGGWSPAGFDSPPPTQGVTWLGLARRCLERPGLAGQGRGTSSNDVRDLR